MSKVVAKKHLEREQSVMQTWRSLLQKYHTKGVSRFIVCEVCSVYTCHHHASRHLIWIWKMFLTQCSSIRSSHRRARSSPYSPSSQEKATDEPSLCKGNIHYVESTQQRRYDGIIADACGEQESRCRYLCSRFRFIVECWISAIDIASATLDTCVRLYYALYPYFIHSVIGSDGEWTCRPGARPPVT